MIKYIKTLIAICAVAALWAAGCKKTNYNPAVIHADTTLALRTAAQYQMGVGVEYDSMMNHAKYTTTVLTQFNYITPGYSMKHGAVVQNDGSYNFSQADNLVTLCTQAGLGVYGHTLCWYQNNNGNYLRSLLALPSATATSNPELLPNGSFEGGTAATVSNTGSTYGSICTNWTGQVQGASVGSLSLTTTAGQFYAGSRALEAVVTTAPANGYQFQAFPDGTGIPTLVSGTSYHISFYAMASGAATPTIQIQTQNGGYQTTDITLTTGWAKYSCDLTPSGGDASRFNFQFINTGTFFIDSVSVTLTHAPAGAATAAELDTRIDTTLHNFINAMVTRYKGTVHAWDVVNEPFQENGQYRNDTSSFSDTFPWWTYLGGGDSMISKAFSYAHTADPSALLFLNEYNQEESTLKLDSMVAAVTRLTKAGVPIGGVGLQMHISINTPNTGIDNAMLQLAATGLKVRVSELDVKVNPGQTPNFVVTQVLLAQQAAKFQYVVESFYRNVPAAQRYGITVWGVTDKDSWLVTPTNIDYPLLWDASFNKKQAYYDFLTGLQLK